MKASVSLAALLALAVMATPGYAEKVYRWVDDDGVTHFTAHPPRDRDSSELRTRTGHSAPVDYSGQFGRAEDNTPPTTESSGGQREAEPQLSQAELDEACRRARQNLQVLQEGGRIASQTAEGSPRYLTDQEKTERLEQARRIIQEAC